MSNYNSVFFTLFTLMNNQVPVLRSHFETVDHHKRSNFYRYLISAHFKKIMKMSILKVKLAIEFVILLIKCATGNEDANAHKYLNGRQSTVDGRPQNTR